MSLSQTDLYNLAIAQGLTPARAKVAAAIGMAESGGDPNAHNYNLSTGDDSWGAWQINMLGAMGPERRKRFGISDNSQLTDPQINAKAMAMLSQNGGNFTDWSTYVDGAYRKFLDNHLIQTTGPGPQGGSNWLDNLLPGSPVSSAETIAQGFNKTAAWVSNSENWVRVGYVAGGTVIVVIGLSMVLSGTKAGGVISGLAPTPGGIAKRARTVTGGANKIKSASSAASKPGGAADIRPKGTP